MLIALIDLKTANTQQKQICKHPLISQKFLKALISQNSQKSRILQVIFGHLECEFRHKFWHKSY